MKTSQEIITMIESKASEHEAIVRQVAGDVEIIRKKLAEIIQAKAAKEVLMTQTQAMMVLKDRLMFHKACILQLNDLLKEIKQ